VRKLLVTIGLAAALAACNSKPKQTSQAQTTSSLAPNQTGQPTGQATNPPPQAASVNPPPTSVAPPAAQSAPPVTNPAQGNEPAQPAPGQPQSQTPQESTSQPAAAPEPAPRIAIPAGTPVRVRLEQTIDTKRNRPGDRFEASLMSPIRVDGNVVVPRGTTFNGHVTEAKTSGRFKGRAVLGVELDSFRLNGVSYRVMTAPDTRVSGRHRKRNWILMGGGTGLGAALGAVAGGGAGALIGAGAGAGAGAAGAFFTGKKNVSLPVETPLTFRLRNEVALNGGRQPG
jgi:hypothetical protein